MTTDAFLDLYTDPSLREEVNRICAGRSRRKCIRDEYRQEAWLWIGAAPGGHDESYYLQIARKAVASAYWQHRKDILGRDDLADLQHARHLAIAKDLGKPPYYSDGFVGPPRFDVEMYTGMYDCDQNEVE